MKTVQELIEMAKKHEMTEEEREQQRISFVYGNLKLDDCEVTRYDVEKASQKIKESK